MIGQPCRRYTPHVPYTSTVGPLILLIYNSATLHLLPASYASVALRLGSTIPTFCIITFHWRTSWLIHGQWPYVSLMHGCVASYSSCFTDDEHYERHEPRPFGPEHSVISWARQSLLALRNPPLMQGEEHATQVFCKTSSGGVYARKRNIRSMKIGSK